MEERRDKLFVLAAGGNADDRDGRVGRSQIVRTLSTTRSLPLIPRQQDLIK